MYGLSPRLRSTLELLLDGLSENKIALKLEVRPATVHEYVGKIYRHFHVQSRAELMAYFLRRRPR
jgi:DNA-binding NarL/FixJ family response regulator